MLNNQASNHPSPQSRRGIFAAILIASLVTLALLAVSLPLKYVEREREMQGAFYFTGSWVLSELKMPSMAGWPMRFMIQYPGEHQARYFSWGLMLGNFAIAFVLGLLVYWAVRFRERKIFESSHQSRTQKYCDVFLACVILLVPIVFLGAARLSSERQRRILRTIGKDANVELSCWYPKLFADKIPSALRSCFLKPRGIEFIRASYEEIAPAMALKDLVGLSFYRSEVPDDCLLGFSNHHHLSRLSLVSQPITEKNVQSISSLKHIERSRMNGNGLNAELLSQLSHWSKLASVDLRRNAIELSKFHQPVWAKTVTALSLTRPQKGVRDELTIEDWPRLKRLSVRSNSDMTNDSVFTVKLTNLPRLNSLLLDRLQKHSLDLTGLPELEEIDDLPDGQSRLTRQDIWIPGGCWVESVRLVGLPRLSNCSFFSRDLRHFEVDEMPNCELMEFTCDLVSSSGWGKRRVNKGPDCQGLINVLGKVEGLKSLVFSSLPLTNMDMSPLIHNTGIQKLGFLQCGIDASQIDVGSPMEHLVEIDLGDCVLEEGQLRRLLTDYPNLDVLKASGMELKEVDLVEPNQLKKLQLNRLGNIESLRMIDQHTLVAEVQCMESPSTLVIKNSESLLGIVLEKPLKPGATITGLRDLEWFAAGGPEVNDQIVQQVLTCPDLDRLTLAYPRLSRAMLRQIGQVRHLTALIIPGAGIDQDITDAWESLQSLWEINLDESEIGEATIRWLSRNESLRSVSLARAKINTRGLKSLRLLNQVVELSLPEVAVTYSDIAALLHGDSLEYLDLSGCQIDDEMMRGLLDAKELRTIKLHRCELAKSQVEALQSAKPRLRVITDDEPLRRNFRLSSVVDRPEPVVGMKVWVGAGKAGSNRAYSSAFTSGTVPAVRDSLDLNHFRGLVKTGADNM